MLNLTKKKTASLVVIKGGRRIGKSRLVQEFVNSFNLHRFTGIPPTGHTTNESQINEFVRQMRLNLNLPEMKFTRSLEGPFL